MWIVAVKCKKKKKGVQSLGIMSPSPFHSLKKGGLGAAPVKIQCSKIE